MPPLSASGLLRSKIAGPDGNDIVVHTVGKLLIPGHSHDWNFSDQVASHDQAVIMAAVINELVSGIMDVVASELSVTIATRSVGVAGNSIALASNNIRMVPSGATLEGGIDAAPTAFTFDTLNELIIGDIIGIRANNVPIFGIDFEGTIRVGTHVGATGTFDDVKSGIIGGGAHNQRVTVEGGLIVGIEELP
jgi:hypothetical protein